MPNKRPHAQKGIIPPDLRMTFKNSSSFITFTPDFRALLFLADPLPGKGRPKKAKPEPSDKAAKKVNKPAKKSDK
jgi:hypothetical protein